MSAALAGKVQTVDGPIDPESMGMTLPHEHPLVDLSRCFTPPVLRKLNPRTS
jgi:predicted metal-dependent phosphotriesterase family hydrolase